MVDRIDKIDPHFYRVQETNDERGKRHSFHEEEEHSKKEETDKFEKGKASNKRLLSGTRSRSSTLLSGNLADKKAEISHISHIRRIEEEAKEESSVSLTDKVLVVWGVVDGRGKLRVPIIVSYAAVLTAIAISAILLMRLL